MGNIIAAGVGINSLTSSHLYSFNNIYLCTKASVDRWKIGDIQNRPKGAWCWYILPIFRGTQYEKDLEYCNEKRKRW